MPPSPELLRWLEKVGNYDYIPVGILRKNGTVEEAYAYGPIRETTEAVHISYYDRPARLFALVNIHKVVPSRRRFRTFDSVIEPESPQVEVPLTAEEVLHDSLSKSYTHNEFRALTNNPNILVDNLTPLGTRTCRITGEPATFYGKRAQTVKLDNIQTLDQLKKCYEGCQDCALGVARKERGAGAPVFGRGSLIAKAIILGEAPGRQEEETGVPFFPGAPAGNVLARVMTRVGLDQDQWYISNSVVCRPMPDKPGSENGKPTAEHLRACLPRIKALLKILQPKLVVLLGRYAYMCYYGKHINTVSEVIGLDPNSPPFVYFTYHPAYIVRKMNSKAPEDVILVRGYRDTWQKIANLYQKHCT